MTLDPTTSLREPNAGPRVDSVENQLSEMRGPSSSEPRTEAERDNLLLLLGVSCIAACCLCWFLEHLAYLLRPLVFAVGLSLILRPFVDFASDARYQRHKLRVWNVRPPWYPRMVIIPRLVALPIAIALVMLVAGTFVWALYLSEQWINQHWNQKDWNDRFIARVNDLADFTDRIALRLLKKDDFALASWHTLQDEVELTLKDEAFWTQFANNLFNYLGDAAICLFYVLFLVAPPAPRARLRSKIVRRIHASVKRFVGIMVALSAVRATLVGLLIWACGMPGSLSTSIAVVSFWLFFIPNLGSFALRHAPSLCSCSSRTSPPPSAGADSSSRGSVRSSWGTSSDPCGTERASTSTRLSSSCRSSSGSRCGAGLAPSSPRSCAPRRSSSRRFHTRARTPSRA